MELNDHLHVIWRAKVAILAASLAVALAVGVLSASRPETFASEAILQVTAGDDEGVTEGSTLFLTRTFAELAETRGVVALGLRSAGFELDVDEALERTSASAGDDVGFLAIAATGRTPQEAADLAQGVAESLIAEVDDEQARRVAADLSPLEAEADRLAEELASLEPGTAAAIAAATRYEAVLSSVIARQLQPRNRIDLVTPARTEEGPVSPTPRRDALVALVLALVVNAELAVLLHALGDRFRADGTEDVHDVTGLPVLEHLPRAGEAATQEAFRSLRTNLLFLETDERLRTVAIVSVDAGAGRSFVAHRLALVTADLGIPVALVDADLREPIVHELAGLPAAPGLAEVLRRHDEPASAVRPHPAAPQVSVLTAGGPVDDATAALGAGRFAEVLAGLPAAELVVVDTPPAGTFADAIAVASQCDATLVVVDARGSRRRSVRQLVERLRLVGANPIGVVVNRVADPGRGRRREVGTAPVAQRTR